MKGVILAGGRGTRLRPITHTGPKQLIPVANKPVLQYAIEDLREAGITDLGVVLGNKGQEEIQQFLGDGSEFGVSITYIIQGNPLGLAHAAGCAEEFVEDDDFVVYLGDNITKYGITDLVKSFEQTTYGASIAIQDVDSPERFGIVELDDAGDVVTLVEKPEDPPSTLALIGTFVFSPAIFNAIEKIEPSERGELEITAAIRALLNAGYDIDAHPVTGWWKDTGKPEDILDANRFILEQRDIPSEIKKASEADITGRVELAVGATVEPGAVIRGPVSIDEGSIIKTGTYIGPYTSIGPNCIIEEAHIENSLVIGDAEIRTEEKIFDSLIGKATTIGSSESSLPEGNRLIVGENSRLKI